MNSAADRTYWSRGCPNLHPLSVWPATEPAAESRPGGQQLWRGSTLSRGKRFLADLVNSGCPWPVPDLRGPRQTGQGLKPIDRLIQWWASLPRRSPAEFSVSQTGTGRVKWAHESPEDTASELKLGNRIRRERQRRERGVAQRSALHTWTARCLARRVADCPRPPVATVPPAPIIEAIDRGAS